MLGLACGGLVVLSSPADSAVARPFTPRFQASVRGDIIAIGNTVVTCLLPVLPNVVSCASARAGAAVDNEQYTHAYVDVDGVLGTIPSSQATLELPAGASVLWAGLYWTGSALSGTAARASIGFAPPGQGYTTLTGEVSEGGSGTGLGPPYSAFVEVTPLVQTSGTYSVADLATALGVNPRGGWALVVAIQDPSQPPRHLAVYDGHAYLEDSAGENSVTVPISGFLTPPSGPVGVRVGALAGDGDRGQSGDSLLNSVALSDAANPADNFFNSSISRLGADITAKNPDYVNQLGFDLDYVAAPAGAVGNSQTQATVTFVTQEDDFQPSVLFTAVDIAEPALTATKTAAWPGSGSTVNPGTQIEYAIQVGSTGGESAADVRVTDVIPANTTYVPGSLTIDGAAATDAAGDDRAEFDPVGGQVTARLGTGATATAGGTLVPGAASTLRLRVQVDSPVAAETVLRDQATVQYSSPATGEQYSTLSDDPALPGDADPTDTAVNTPPTAPPAQVTTPEDTPLEFDLAAVADDPDGDPLTFTVSQAPATAGTLSCSAAGACLFTPDTDFNGAVNLTYTARDPGGLTAGGPLTITVTAVNDPPVARDDSASTLGDTPVTVDVLANDTDPDGDPLTVSPGTQTTAGGEVTCSTTVCTYTPNPGFIGQDGFTYTVLDPAGAGDTATVTVTVSMNPADILAISVPGSADLGEFPAGSTRVSGQLGVVTVTDSRQIAPSQWTVTVSATPFVNETAADWAIPPSAVEYSAGPLLDMEGTGTVTLQPGATLGTAAVAAALTGGSATTSVSWNPTLTVDAGILLAPGAYTATITHSIA